MNPSNPASPPTPRRRARRLRSAENIRAFVADVLRRVEGCVPESERLDVARAHVMLRGASVLASLVQGSDFEDRLRELERQAGKAIGSPVTTRSSGAAARGLVS